MTTLPWLEPGQAFPPADTALDDPNGLLAAGADLSVSTLVSAYQQGIFPWFNPGEPTLWWSPDPRLTLAPNDFHCSRSLRKLLKGNQFQFSLNQCFAQVVDACAQVPRQGQHGTWIVPTMKEAYTRLHNQGYAFSVEVWEEHRLAGGLYGVHIGQMLFGESMFSLTSNASKAALAWLCHFANSQQCQLIDCQVETSHLVSLGAQSMDRDEFIDQVQLYTSAPHNPFPCLAAAPFPI